MSLRSPRTLLILALLPFLLVACTQGDVDEVIEASVMPDPASVSQAQAVVDQAITTHGGSVLQHAIVEFDFRDKHFKITREGGFFEYERTYIDGDDTIREVLNNDGIFREVNGQRVRLSNQEATGLATPLNSVPYFALLPFNLNDPAVKKRYLEEATIEGEPYDKVEVTFQEEGGGSDYEDRFIYWFHKDNHTMDYLAYDYHRNETGTRFRRAFNVRTIGGVRIADFHNLVSDSLPKPGMPIERYDVLMEQGAVELLSEIILENVTVQPLTPSTENPAP